MNHCEEKERFLKKVGLFQQLHSSSQMKEENAYWGRWVNDKSKWFERKSYENSIWGEKIRSFDGYMNYELRKSQGEKSLQRKTKLLWQLSESLIPTTYI